MLSLASIATGQTPFSKFGKVTPEDFRATDFDNAGYDAVILQNEKSMYFDYYQGNLRLFNKYHVRIKVLKDDFSDQDFFTVHFSGRYDYDLLLDKKCLVFSLNGTKVSKTKPKFKSFKTYQGDSVNSWQTVELPILQKGQIVDWEYTVATFDFMMPDLCKFNSKYPSVANLLVTNFPYFMQYKYDLRGYDTLLVNHTRSDDFVSVMCDGRTPYFYIQGSAASGFGHSFNYRFSSVCDSFYVYNTVPVDMLPADQAHPLYGTASVRMMASRFSQNIGYSGTYYNYWQSITHLLYVYADPDNRFLSLNEAYFHQSNPAYLIVDSHNWPRLYKRLTKDPQFWKPVLKNHDYPPELSYLLDPDEYPDTMRVVSDVCKYVSANYKWTGEYCNHLRNGLKDIKSSREGNSADINMLAVSYLRHYGADAFPIMVATEDFGDVDPNYANIQQFNTVMVGIRTNRLASDGSDVFLIIDAAIPYTGELGIRTLKKGEIAWAVDMAESFFVEYTGNTGDTYNAKKISFDD